MRRSIGKRASMKTTNTYSPTPHIEMARISGQTCCAFDATRGLLRQARHQMHEPVRHRQHQVQHDIEHAIDLRARRDVRLVSTTTSTQVSPSLTTVSGLRRSSPYSAPRRASSSRDAWARSSTRSAQSLLRITRSMRPPRWSTHGAASASSSHFFTRQPSTCPRAAFTTRPFASITYVVGNA